MPPRTAKKTPPGPGMKRTARARAMQKTQVQPEETNVKAEEMVEEQNTVVVIEEKKATEPGKEAKEKESATKDNGDASGQKDDEVKNSIDEYETGERLDLEDNEPDYEPEEYVGVDYDEKEIEQDAQEEGDKVGEELEEGDIGEEEEGDVVEEEIEDVQEELEPEEYDEHAGEEHAEMVDAAEAEEHHKVFKERRKRKEFEIFVGGLDKDATEDDLRKVFSEVGEVTEARLMMNPQTKKNKGFAFLRFATAEQARRACSELKNPVVHGKQCGVTPSQDSDTLFLGNICKTWTKEAVKTVFVDGLLASWDEDHIRKLLKKYGAIEKVELARNMPSARRKDFGFVTFDTHDAAVNCAKSINNEDLGEGDNKARVRVRLSRPLQRGKGKHSSRADFQPGRGSVQGVRSPWSRPVPRSIPLHRTRGYGARLPPIVDRGFKRPANIRDRRPALTMPPRSRPPAPLPRSYDRRPPVPVYPKSGLKRDYGHREALPPRSRAATDYNSRVPPDRRSSYRDDYSPRGSGYPDFPRGGTARTAARRAYVDDTYSQRYERPPPTYREGRVREYDSVSGSKRPYVAVDDVPPRYAEAGVRHSRARLDYDFGESTSQYGDAYSDRLGRSNLGYDGSRSSLSSQDSHGLYSSRQGMSYGGGSYDGSDVSGMYSSNYGSDYMSRGSDVGGSSYSSLYSGRSMGGSSYMGSGGSGSYY
ncbi:nucleolin-like isoform X2 [Olea europaea subsp. europaea]|uniref:Nucleolin-like isoform X2 n=1 Tax=Olea europaea subsp. europaea TaxID=158383 RepID=A0A8S0U479_OLEEU|nr:nucleolin-like isoform X2 [Olea europaea subsp. europaea]